MDMKISEIVRNPLKAMTPAQARIASLKRNVDNARAVLKTEQDRQRRKREAERAKRNLDALHRSSLRAPHPQKRLQGL